MCHSNTPKASSFHEATAPTHQYLKPPEVIQLAERLLFIVIYQLKELIVCDK